MRRPLLLFLCILAGLLSVGSAASTYLPFDMPSTATLRASSHKAFSHFFTMFTQSEDNNPPATDYYTKNWYMVPAGEGGVHAAYGGYLRDRPYPRQPLTGDWMLQDMQKEVNDAIAAGLDGFTVDLLNINPTGYHWARVLKLLQAAINVDPGFKLVPMPDMASLTSVTTTALAQALATFANYSSAYRLPDGRLVVSPFLAEKQLPSWWTSVFTTLQSTYGVSVAFVPCFLNFGANRVAFKPICYGYSNWGNRAPNMQGSGATNTAAAHADGMIWMQPVSTQDERPYAGTFWEGGNSENLRASWADAIGPPADWVQIPTWDDYSEGANVAPSLRNTWAWLDMSAYYLVRWKTGAYPAIVRDVVYLTHRTHMHATLPSYNETKLMTLAAGSMAPRDTIEVLSFLTAPANITITVGGASTTYWAPAGVNPHLIPLTIGNVSAIAYRFGVYVTGVQSNFAVKATPYVQDFGYYAVSSGRAPIIPPPTTVPTLPVATTAPPATTIPAATTPAPATTTPPTSPPATTIATSTPSPGPTTQPPPTTVPSSTLPHTTAPASPSTAPPATTTPQGSTLPPSTSSTQPTTAPPTSSPATSTTGTSTTLPGSTTQPPASSPSTTAPDTSVPSTTPADTSLPSTAPADSNVPPPASTTGSATTSAPTQNPSSATSSGSGGSSTATSGAMSAGIVVAIVAGALILAAVLAVSAFLIWKKYIAKPKQTPLAGDYVLQM